MPRTEPTVPQARYQPVENSHEVMAALGNKFPPENFRSNIFRSNNSALGILVLGSLAIPNFHRAEPEEWSAVQSTPTMIGN
jgi:hypothetical protein